jgi:photoactive yellow protein
MSFVPDELLPQFPQMSPEQLDAFDFGVVRVDDRGVIQSYNRYESSLANISPSIAIGKNFFTQIAPCTNNRLIYGKFKEGMASGELNALVPYVFTYRMRPTLVQVRMWRDPATKTNWVMVKRAGSTK